MIELGLHSLIIGTKRYVVVSGGLDKPHDIEVDSAAGILFWSDVGQAQPKIERAGLDGSDRDNPQIMSAK